MAKQKKYHYIYKTTCSVTGKFYVGMHSTDDLEDVYLGSGKILGYSRRKHGDENHKREILEYCFSRESLKSREREIVNEELIADKLCMNLQLGGFGGLTTTEHADKFHKAGHASMTKNLTAEQRTARSVKTNQTRRLNGTLKPWSAAAIEAARFSEKRKATFAEIGHMQGEKNSQFGTCWVTDGIKPVKIKKQLLDEYLAKGFIRGRKFHAATTC